MAPPFRDYYDVLGVPRTATEEEIKRAYRKLAREHHPDLHAGKEKETHHRRMQEVNEAYSVLSSNENRAKYDQFGEHWKEGPPPPPPPSEGDGNVRFNPEEAEAFSRYFHDMFGRAARPEADEMFPSELDIEATVDLSLADAVHGGDKSFSLMTTGLCQNCRGTGRKNNTFCPVCGGVGEVQRQRNVTAHIPPGLLDGGRIRLRGQGNEGARGRGDLYLRIRLAPDPRFRVQGANLETTVPVTPWRAALGGDIPVAILDGTVRVRIPKGTRTGTRLRIAGKGLGKAGQRGDLFVRVEIDNPAVLSPDIEALFRQMEEKSNAGLS